MRTKRFLLLPLLVLTLVIVPSRSAEKDLGGNWVFIFTRQRSKDPVWLIQFKQTGKNWTGKVLAAGEEYRKAELSNLSVKEGKAKFTLTLPGGRRFNIVGNLPESGANFYGAFETDGEHTPIELRRTKLTTLNRAVLDRKTLAESQDRMEIIEAARRLVGEADNLKAKSDEVKSWADQAVKAASVYGSGYQREILLDLVKRLNEQDGMAAVALPLAEMAEKTLTKTDVADTQIKVWNLLAVALRRAGKSKEADAIAARIKTVDYGVRVVKYPGRTGKADRVAVVELFTGTECPPCIAADMAFDGIAKTYKPTEVIVLQYHVHIPGPDPLTSEASLARFKSYQEFHPGALRGTPSILFNGTPAPLGGGGKKQAQGLYKRYTSIVNPILDKVARASLKVSATRKDDKISIEVDASNVKDAAETTLLRVILAEEEVSYTGGNTIAKHHFVVRALVNKAEGDPVEKKDLKKTYSIDVSEVRKKLKTYLTKYHKSPRGPFASDKWPMDLKKLHVIALLQDDNSAEII